MLEYIDGQADSVTGQCECGRQITLSLDKTKDTRMGFMLEPPVICSCGAKHVTLRLPAEVLEERSLSEDERRRREEARKLAAMAQEQIESVRVLSLPMVPAHTVEQLYDVISAEVVLGTGFLSEWNATFADFFGVQSTLMEEKLDAAKQAAINKLKSKAALLGANAVLSVDIDYHSIGTNLLMVVASGTPVRLQSTTCG